MNYLLTVSKFHVIKHKGKYLLLLIYVATIAIVSFRVAVHPTSYTTPDSEFYLSQANVIKNSLLQDNTFLRLKEIKKGFSTWPIGYPMSIGLVSSFTKLSLLVSSKLVNFVFLGCLFVLLYRWFGDKTWFLAISFFSYGSMEVISETWSETPFIFFVFLLGYTMVKSKDYSSLRLCLSLSLCLIFLFLFRYVGAIYVFVVAVYGATHFFKKEKKLAYLYLTASFVSSLFILWYLYTNKLSTGYMTGLERVDIGHQSPLNFVVILVKGLLNEFFIARNYSFNGAVPDVLFIILIILQGSVIFVLIWHKKHFKFPLKLSTSNRSLLNLSLSYLTGIILLKFIIPIDNFDFRILFPFTCPFFIAFLSILISPEQTAYFRKTSWIIALFMIISFALSLPKKYIINQIAETSIEQK